MNSNQTLKNNEIEPTQFATVANPIDDIDTLMESSDLMQLLVKAADVAPLNQHRCSNVGDVKKTPPLADMCMVILSKFREQLGDKADDYFYQFVRLAYGLGKIKGSSETFETIRSNFANPMLNDFALLQTEKDDRIQGLETRNELLRELKAIAIERANNYWNSAKHASLKIGQMAELVYQELVDLSDTDEYSPLRKQLPKDHRAVRAWIGEIAPSEAKTPGRPKK